MSEPWCCFISPDARFDAPGMTKGDERAEIARYGCKLSAKWQIYGPSGMPDDNTQACDAHKTTLSLPGGLAYPI